MPDTGTRPPHCLTARDAARYLRVRLAAVLAWIKSGALRAANIGTGTRAQYRISPSAIEDFLAARSAKDVKTTRRRRTAKADSVRWIEALCKV